MHFRIEATCQPAGWLQFVPQAWFQAWLGRQLRLKLQLLLHTVRLQPPDVKLEYAWESESLLRFFGDTPDNLKPEELGLRPDLCADIGKRLQSVGYKFVRWKNPLLPHVRQVNFVLPNGQQFTYPQDAEKGETFTY